MPRSLLSLIHVPRPSTVQNLTNTLFGFLCFFSLYYEDSSPNSYFFTRTNVSYHRCHIQKGINMETQCIRHQIRIRLVQFQIVVVAASDSIELILPLNTIM